MRKRLLLTLAALVALSAGTGSALAQSANGSVSVTAANVGVFEFTITDASFDFGNVDANGTLSSTGVSGARNGANDGAVYTASAATTWTCSSAPSRTVRVYNASSASTINWGNADRLSLQIPATGLPVGSTSCGSLTFSTAGDGGAGACASGNLVHSVDAGNGSNSASGNLDLQLEVLDSDGTGSNTWTVVLTASAS
jgi:hypothetical protein